MLELYWVPLGAPSRAVMMTIKYLGLDVKTNQVNPLEGETQKPEYLKIYPLHKVPFITDGNFQLGESRAILGYLVDKYGKDDSLYPKDTDKRAKINAIMFWEMDSVYSGIVQYVIGIIRNKTNDPEKKEKVDKSLKELETHILGSKKFLAGDKVTIADISAVAGITFLELVQYDFSERKALCEWIGRMKAFSFYKEGSAFHEEYKTK